MSDMPWSLDVLRTAMHQEEAILDALNDFYNSGALPYAQYDPAYQTTLTRAVALRRMIDAREILSPEPHGMEGCDGK